MTTTMSSEHMFAAFPIVDALMEAVKPEACLGSKELYGQGSLPQKFLDPVAKFLYGETIFLFSMSDT